MDEDRTREVRISEEYLRSILLDGGVIGSQDTDVRVFLVWENNTRQSVFEGGLEGADGLVVCYTEGKYDGTD